MSPLLASSHAVWGYWSKWWNGERCWTICRDMLWQRAQLKRASHLAQHFPLKASQNVSSYAPEWEGGSSERLRNTPNIAQQIRRGRLQTHLPALKSLLFTKRHLEVHWGLCFALRSLKERVASGTWRLRGPPGWFEVFFFHSRGVSGKDVFSAFSHLSWSQNTFPVLAASSGSHSPHPDPTVTTWIIASSAALTRPLCALLDHKLPRTLLSELYPGL